MRTLQIFLYLLTTLVSSCSSGEENNSKQNSNLVMICDSPDAYAYHSRHCHGLSSCESQIIQISKEEAIGLERRACGYCY